MKATAVVNAEGVTHNEDIAHTEAFLDDGFTVFNLNVTEQYHTLREALLQKLKTLVADDVSFEQYHQFVTNEEEHKRIQFALFNYVHEIGLHNHEESAQRCRPV